MPDFHAQCLPDELDYQHDVSLAQTAAWEANHRIAMGERESEVVADLISKTARAYIGTPWVAWHPRLRLFLTWSDLIELDWLAAEAERMRRD